jgi:hypothetical protein
MDVQCSLYFLLVVCLGYTSTLKKEAVCSSEISMNTYQTYQTTWCNIEKIAYMVRLAVSTTK